MPHRIGTAFELATRQGHRSLTRNGLPYVDHDAREEEGQGHPLENRHRPRAPRDDRLDRWDPLRHARRAVVTRTDRLQAVKCPGCAGLARHQACCAAPDTRGFLRLQVLGDRGIRASFLETSEIASSGSLPGRNATVGAMSGEEKRDSQAKRGPAAAPEAPIDAWTVSSRPQANS